MQPYPHSGIICNGRGISIDEIIRRTVTGLNTFEQALFQFIRDWFNEVDHFELTTSGSTGPPKTIVVTRSQMIASARLTTEVLQLERGQTALLCLSPEFIAGKMMIVRSLETGLAIVAVNPSSQPMEGVKHFIDFAAMVPLQIHDMLQRDIHAFQNLQTVIIGGGTIDNADAELLKQLPCRFYATYGMTETVSHVALRKINGEGASPYFKALPGIRFSLDERGCLIIHWAPLNRPLVTNDLVELVDDVKFLWLGRWDNVINSGGRKIIPEKLEAAIQAALSNAGQTRRFFVASVPDARLGNMVIMVIEGDHTIQADSVVRDILQSSLQSFEVPKKYVSYPRFIETQTGKINRIATLELAISRNRSSD